MEEASGRAPKMHTCNYRKFMRVLELPLTRKEGSCKMSVRWPQSQTSTYQAVQRNKDIFEISIKVTKDDINEIIATSKKMSSNMKLPVFFGLGSLTNLSLMLLLLSL